MTNRLAESQSLYLRKHAENPIDWWSWCDEAIEVARRENKPIFLSIGYSSCHWCTVMEGEAFSDSAIADYMNANFIPIKVGSSISTILQYFQPLTLSNLLKTYYLPLCNHYSLVRD